MQNAIKVFKGSINDMEDEINTWAADNNFVILNTSVCFDEKASFGGYVFVIVVYTTASA